MNKFGFVNIIIAILELFSGSVGGGGSIGEGGSVGGGFSCGGGSSGEGGSNNVIQNATALIKLILLRFVFNNIKTLIYIILLFIIT